MGQAILTYILKPLFINLYKKIKYKVSEFFRKRKLKKENAKKVENYENSDNVDDAVDGFDGMP